MRIQLMNCTHLPRGGSVLDCSFARVWDNRPKRHYGRGDTRQVRQQSSQPLRKDDDVCIHKNQEV
jgi:hypothetical protein